jgi:hypothetical protein
MIRGVTATILWSVMAGIVAIGLFLIKQDVKGLENRLTTLNTDIARSHSEIHVLQAEWSYLDEPARLRTLSERYLGLQPIAPTQIATLKTLPMDGSDGGPALADRSGPEPMPIRRNRARHHRHAEPRAIASAGAAPLTIDDVVPDTGAR